MRSDFTDCARFYENEQTAREVNEKSCFGRKWPQNDILTCMCRLETDYRERKKSFGMVQTDLKSVEYLFLKRSKRFLFHTPLKIRVYHFRIASSAALTSVPLSSAPLSSAPLSSSLISSAPLNAAPLSSAPLSSAPLTSAPLSSASLSSAQLQSLQLRSPQLRSLQLRSAQPRSAQLREAQLCSAQLFSILTKPQKLVQRKMTTNLEPEFAIFCVET